MSTVSCEELRARLPLLLVDLMEPAEAEQAREHLNAGCPACASEVAAAREVLDILPLSLEPASPSATVRSRILAAARKESREGRQEGGPADAAGRPVWPWALVSALLAAALAAFLTTSITSNRRSGEVAAVRAELTGARGDLEARETEMAGLQAELDSATAEFDSLRSTDLSALSLVPPEGGGEALATLIWDRTGGRWHLRVWDLPPASAGRTYQLWAIAAPERIGIALFNTDVEGRASVSATLPEGTGLIVAAGISEEPEGGSPAPTEELRLVGQVR